MIDMLAGPTAEEMAVFPTRAVELADGRTAYSFTMFRARDAGRTIREPIRIAEA